MAELSYLNEREFAYFLCWLHMILGIVDRKFSRNFAIFFEVFTIMCFYL